MSLSAQKIWNELIDQLWEMNLVTSLDTSLLVEYCEYLSILKDLRTLLKNQIKENLPTQKTIDQLDKIGKAAQRIGESFGLTPKGRKMMGIEIKKVSEAETQADKREKFVFRDDL